MPVDALFSQHPALIVTLQQAARVRNGAEVRDGQFPDGMCRVYCETGEFLMLGEVRAHTLRTVKNFFEVN